MLSLVIRIIVIYLFLFLAMRLMGKRQLGELQPFEFAITLVAADLACIPMQDASIPIIYGILPVFTLFLLHFLITKISVKSIRFRRILNGRPVIVIEKGNILCDVLKSLDMTTHDLMESLRGAGFFTPADVEYAIIETSGKISVMPKFANSPATNADLKITGGMCEMPTIVIAEGHFLSDNFSNLQLNIAKHDIDALIRSRGLEQKDVYLLTMTGSGNVFCQPYKENAWNDTVST